MPKSEVTPNTHDHASPLNLFIIGAPRSGTTWLMMLLVQHPSIAAIQQCGLMHAILPLHSWWKQSGGHGRRVIPPANLHWADTSAKPKLLGDLLGNNRFRKVCVPIVNEVFDCVRRVNPGVSVVCDQTPENLELHEMVLELNPDAHYVHLIRDPRSVYCSMKKANAGWAKNSFPRSPEAVGTVWSKYMVNARELEGRSDHYSEVKYEDLIDDASVQLLSIWQSLGLESTERFAKEAVENCSIEKLRTAALAPKNFFREGRKMGWHNEATRSQVRCLEYVAQSEMRHHGYDLSSDVASIEPLPVKLRALRCRATQIIRQILRR